MTLPGLATCWLGGCSGCHMSLLNLHNGFPDLLQRCRLLYSPLMDLKDFPEMVDIAVVEGAVNSRESRDMARLIRQRSRLVVALGECACRGNVTALRNSYDVHAMIDSTYGSGFHPPQEGELLPQALALHRVIRVDAFLPGCPPDPAAISTILEELFDHC